MSIEEDRVVWKSDSQGRFFVKALYFLLILNCGFAPIWLKRCYQDGFAFQSGRKLKNCGWRRCSV